MYTNVSYRFTCHRVDRTEDVESQVYVAHPNKFGFYLKIPFIFLVNVTVLKQRQYYLREEIQ